MPSRRPWIPCVEFAQPPRRNGCRDFPFLLQFLSEPVGRCWIQLEELLDPVDHLKSPATSTYPDRQANAALPIHPVQEPESPAIQRLIELEVDCPDVVGGIQNASSRQIGCNRL